MRYICVKVLRSRNVFFLLVENIPQTRIYFQIAKVISCKWLGPREPAIDENSTTALQLIKMFNIFLLTERKICYRFDDTRRIYIQP